jgi:hypothetical protein
MDGVTIEETPDENMVKVKTDRPGERATSAVVDGRELIAEVAEVLGLEFTLTAPEEQPPA